MLPPSFRHQLNRTEYAFKVIRVCSSDYLFTKLGSQKFLTINIEDLGGSPPSNL